MGPKSFINKKYRNLLLNLDWDLQTSRLLTVIGNLVCTLAYNRSFVLYNVIFIGTMKSY